MEDIKADKIVHMNIIFPLRGSKVLLAIKTRKIGVGLFNGYGGKQEEGQTMTESCAEELFKESSLIALPQDFVQVGIVNFFIHKNDETIVLNKCDIFTVTNFSGEPVETEEMITPTWFEIEKIPMNKMMVDAGFWVKRMLSGEHIEVEVHLDESRKRIIGGIHSKIWN